MMEVIDDNSIKFERISFSSDTELYSLSVR